MTNVAVLGMDCYDDVLEVTKKIYSNTNMETGETIRIVQDYDGETFKLEEGHTSLNAFGLLVQNGFPTSTLFSLTAQQELEKLRAEGDLWISSDETISWTDSKIASYNAEQKLFRCNECECVGFLSRVAEHWLGTHANLRVFQCPQCPYSSAWARCVRMHLARQHNICPDPNQESLTLWKENPVLEEVTKYLERLKNLVEGELVDNVREEREGPEEEEEEEIHQNAIATQTSTPPPDSPEDQPLTPDSQLEQDNLDEQEMHQQELQEQELHEQELHQQELHEQELHQQDLEQELHQQELQQELDEQEIDQQELEQHELQQHELQQHELQQHELHEHELQHKLQQHELQQHELQQHELQQHELQQHELQQHELQHELQPHELQQHELQQHEIQQHELQEQELDEQELQQQQLEQQLQQHEIHQQELSDQVLLQEDQAGGQITHVIEEHIQVPEEIAKQLQQLAAAHGGDIHPQLQIVITQQENQDLPPTIQIQIAQPQDLSNHLVTTSQQTIPLEEALSQSLASTITQQVLAQAQAVTQQIIVQQPQVIQTPVKRKVPSPHQAPTSTSRSRNQSRDSSGSGAKRYNCTVCSYATDRRDLYTRHENIHRDEKPFHCYTCRKQFNRADHVKKHFLRMHQDIPYDINRIRRTGPSKQSASGTIHFYPKSHSRPPPARQVQTTISENISIPGLTTQKIVLQEKVKPPRKRPVEKRHTCPYCTWTGIDNWCLKRHLNTHLKPYVCTMCEYKAARAERLGTHVFKVHNKKACSKCTFLADNQEQLSLHIQQTHK